MSVYNVRSSQTVATAYFSLDAAARACLDPFVPIFLRHHGLTALQAGVVLSVAAILSGLFVPAALWLPRWRRNSWRSVLLASSVVSIVCYLSLLAIPPTTTTSGGSEWVSPCRASERTSSSSARGTHTGVVVDSTGGSIPSIPAGGRVKDEGAQHGGGITRGGEANNGSGRPLPAPSPTYEQLPTAVPLVADPAFLLSSRGATAAVGGMHLRVRRAPNVSEEESDAVAAATTRRPPGPASPPLANNASKDVVHPLDEVSIPIKDKKGMPPVPADPDCQGDETSPDCPVVTHVAEGDTGDGSRMSSADPFLDDAALLLLASAVVLGGSTFALAKFVADESYFAFLDEIDATEKSRSHETYAAVVTALVLGAVAILASQAPCLPLATWGFQEVYLAAFGTLVFASLPLAAFFPEPYQPLRRQATSGACRGVGTVLKNLEGALIVGGLFFLGVLAGLEQTFFMWHLEETGKRVELGVVLMARAVSNVASLFLLCAGGLPSRVLAWLAFGIVCVAARCACYVQSGWELAAVAQLLSPPSTVLLWVACERWARRSSTRLSTERGLLVVMRCCHNGLGFCIGALSGGGTAAWLGVRTTLGAGAVVGVVGGLAMLAASRFVSARPPSYDRLLWDPTSANSDSESEEEPKMAGDAGVPIAVSPVAS
ncbi:major facilitator superfamily domain-containing protein 6-like [Dermacentor variabilis]|uniref:major facilitator superfamily domain-containing protein 6-like n=1 Tax=Dermacentor variabilis TaxID=34621 RepID=UPI003F5B35C8